jgi:uncharacterized protein (DUF2252 family)
MSTVAVSVPAPHATVAERAALGRAARQVVPRSSHAAWERPPGVDPTAIIFGQDAGRVPELVPVRHERMLASPFAFFRAGAAVMAADLAGAPASGLVAQACGDAHLANFGAFAAPDRRLVFDLNDFDETLAAPWEWDVKRLAASLAIAARHRGIDADLRRRIVLTTVAGYRTTMADLAGRRDLDVFYDRKEVEPLMRRLQRRVSTRSAARARRRVARAGSKDSLRALQRLAVVGEDGPRLLSDPPLLVPLRELAPGAAGDELAGRLGDLFERYRATLRDDVAQLLARYRLVDIGRKVVGVGSVGTRCWVLLLVGRDDHDPLVLQAKEAGPSVLEPYAGPGPYDHEGRRVVEGQRLMQGAGDVLLGWVRATDDAGGERDFYVRQLWDAKTSVDLEVIEPDWLELYGELCAGVLARAHARTGDRVAIAAYLGGGPRFDRALAEFSETYADQNERDHAAMKAQVRPGAPADAG